ncbi:MAG TPA: family 1 glycosylhydrolase [Polyangiaceae bacterium]|nr:family 1 glycosylhydrolase [Polyangiaceae bacterium]
MRRLFFALSCLVGCSDEAPPAPPADIAFGERGSLVSPEGKGSFRFGAASAATQIEDQNENTDWWIFTAPEDQGGLGKGKAFVGDASKGYEKALEDVALLRELGLDSYRFSIEWARVEPARDMIDEAALDHYGAFIDALIAAGIEPVITLHHFANPIWVADPRDPECMMGVSDLNLCGLGHPQGGPEIVAEAAELAQLLAEHFGDRVDVWGTVNEPVNYLLAAYGVGTFPPGRTLILAEDTLLGGFVPVVRDYLRFHAAMYQAIRQYDTADADGDGRPADIGLTLNVGSFVPSRDNAVSSEPADVAARDRVVALYHHMFIETLRQGRFDSDLDGAADEDLPEVAGTIDWLGVQYYFRAGVTADPGLVPVLALTPCFGTFDFGSCVPPVNADFTKCVPSMRYEYYEPGVYEVLKDFAARWADLPLFVSESGIATEVGRRRAEHVVRSLEQIARARDEGVDVRGYFHWSLFDNFEWAEGFDPRFGLYHVDYATYARTATEGAHALSDIAHTRGISGTQRTDLGGTGPMTAEPAFVAGEHCSE